MRRLMNVLMLSTMLLVFVQPEIHTTLGRTSRDHRMVHDRLNRLAAVTGIKAAENDGWVVECVECSKQLGGMSERSLQLDAAGHPHIAYGGENLYYAWHDGAKWNIETVDTGHPDVDVRYVSLALDAAGYAHIGYYDEYIAALKYAYQNESGWQFQIVDSNVMFDYWSGVSALVLDETGNPHISYGRGSLHYAHRVSSTWQIQIVDEGTRIMKPSMAIDSGGYPHISYGISDNNWEWYPAPPPSDLMYAYADQGGWHHETVYTNASDGGHRISGSSLVLDANDSPHISFIDSYDLAQYTISSLQYAQRDDTGWQIETVSGLGDCYSTSSNCYSISLALDKKGFPHISYERDIFKQGRSNLEYTYRDEAGWHTLTVVENEENWYASSASIVIGDQGYPHISSINQLDEDEPESSYLMYTTLNTVGWDFQTVDESGGDVGDVGEYNSMVLDREDNPHISYYDAKDQDLKYAYREASSWYTQTVDSAGKVGRYNSLALDVDGHPHISYLEQLSDWNHVVGLKYAYQDGDQWHLRTVDTVEYMDFTSLALDRQGYPHISYYGDGDLKYAYQDENDWYIQTVDIRSWFSSLFLDEVGNPHISYISHGYLSPAYSLKYASWQTDSWLIEVVDSSNEKSYGANSLFLDKDGYPHISYSKDASYLSEMDELNYAYRDEKGWKILSVDSGNSVGGGNSLVLDMLEQPCISYYGSYDKYVPIKYAYWDHSDWQIKNIEFVSSPGENTSLALDGDGEPHITYKANNDLMYAYWVEPTNIWPLENWGYGLPGSIITYTLQVLNTTQLTDTFDVAVSNHAWLTEAPESVGPLAPAESAAMEVVVTIPTTVNLGSRDTVTITVTLREDSSKTGSAKLTTFTGYVHFMPLVGK